MDVPSYGYASSTYAQHNQRFVSALRAKQACICRHHFVVPRVQASIFTNIEARGAPHFHMHNAIDVRMNEVVTSRFAPFGFCEAKEESQ